MKYSMVLCLLAVVLIQQCMSAPIHHEGEKNDEYHETHMKHKGGDHKGHKHGNCDLLFRKVEGITSHKVEDHTDHGIIGNPIYDNPKYDNPIYDNGYGGSHGVHDRPKDMVVQKFRRGQSGHLQ